MGFTRNWGSEGFKPAPGSGGGPPAISSGVYLGRWDFSTLGLADGAAISAVPDGTGNGRTATQAVGANQPVCKTAIANGLAVGRFNGATNFLDTPAFALPATYTICAVGRSTAGVLPQNVFDGDNQSGGFRYFQFRLNTGVLEHIAFNTLGSAFTDSQADVVTAFNCLTGRVDLTTVQTWINGTSDGSTAIAGTGESGNNALRIGARIGNAGPDSFLNGDVGEVLFISGALNTTDRQAVENYLRTKWGTP